MEVWRGPTTPRLKAFNALTFAELFRLSALWHDVWCPPPSEGTEANARYARNQRRQWENFYYDWLQSHLQERWAQQYGLTESSGYLSYRRSLGKHARIGYRDYKREYDYPPCCYHTTLWRRTGTPSRFAEVLVTQPYFYNLDKMIAFATEKDLWFWVSERPAWHFPKGVFFIEWASPQSRFASLRGKQEADDSMKTIHAWKGKQILTGPGTVFEVKHPEAIKRWRDDLDVDSIMRAELTRLIALNDEGLRSVTH